MTPYFPLTQQLSRRPDWSLQLYTGPSVEPVSLDEAKAQMRVDIDDEDSYIADLITVAREALEGQTSRCCLNQIWYQYFDRFPYENFLELRRGPLVSVASVKYTDSTGAITTMTVGSQYIVEPAADKRPPRILLPYAGIWPVAVLQPGMPIQVTFTAGYGTVATSVPGRLKQALLLMVSHLYQNREPMLEGRGVTAIEIPGTIDALISDFTLRYFG